MPNLAPAAPATPTYDGDAPLTEEQKGGVAAGDAAAEAAKEVKRAAEIARAEEGKTTPPKDE